MMYSSVSSSQGQMSAAVKTLATTSCLFLFFTLFRSHYSCGQMPLPVPHNEVRNEAPGPFLSRKYYRLTKDLMSSLAAVCRERAIQSFPSQS